jgi:membrane associated rhomboid family serine protease
MFPLKDENPTERFPFFTLAIILACLAAYFGPQQAVSDEIQAVEFNLQWAAIPCEINTGEPLSIEEIRDTFVDGQTESCRTDGTDTSPFPDKVVYLGVLTSMFLHGGLLHLGGNLWFLWIFGNNIEDRLGHLWFLAFYLVGGVAATLAHYALAPSSTVPVVGASGAIAAVMGAYLVWFPNAPIRTFVFLFLLDITAKWYLGFWFLSQFFIGNDSGVAWAAHVGGFVFGVVVGLAVRATSAGRRMVNRSTEPRWDPTGGAGRGPYPHPFEATRTTRRSR